jgi:hypothetical protein
MTLRRTIDEAMRVVVAGLIGLSLAGAGAPYPRNAEHPPFLDALVALHAVSNGCALGHEPDSASRSADVSTYDRVTVDFADACDLHDAGYVGAAVGDPINGGYVDAFDWSRAQVDAKFLADARSLCRAQISAKHAHALATCVGDTRRYRAVRALDARFFVQRPHVAGTWLSRRHGVWHLTQHSRHVTATWPGGDFDGTVLIGRGPAIINGLGPTFRMVFTVRSPRLMDVVSAGELLTLRRG